MIDEFLKSAFASAGVAILANSLVSILKFYLSSRNKLFDIELLDKSKRIIANIPAAQDIGSSERRIIELEKVSPRLAVLEGWQITSDAILRHLNESNLSDSIKSHDVIYIANQLPEIPKTSVELLAQLKKARNLVAHSAISEESEEEISEIAKKIVPLLRSIELSYQTLNEKR